MPTSIRNVAHQVELIRRKARQPQTANRESLSSRAISATINGSAQATQTPADTVC